jgi:excisionase family DNA binding protein
MDEIIKKLTSIEQKIIEQNLLQKEIINFSEACLYLDLSSSHLYKLTSANAIPCYCPQGKKLYFKRAELDLWLTSHRNASSNEVAQQAANYITKRGRARR